MMRTRTTLLIALIILTFVVGYIFLQGTFPTRENPSIDTPKVAATIYPLYDIVRTVAGEEMPTSLLLPPGASPHFYEFSPQQLKQLQGVEIIFAIGHGLDDWVQTIIEAIPNAEIVIVDDLIDFKISEETVDPHYWLHFGNASQIAETVAQKLGEKDEINKTIYSTNAVKYQNRLRESERSALERIGALQNRKLITLHDAWFYFADNLGLEIVGTFEPAAGEEPTPQYLATLKNTVEENNIQFLFSEPQIRGGAVENFARDNNLSLVTLDPLGGGEGRKTFIELMEYNISQLFER